MKFYANITLCINEFEAEDEETAKKLVDSYITSLAETKDRSLSWEECDYEVKGAE